MLNDDGSFRKKAIKINSIASNRVMYGINDITDENKLNKIWNDDCCKLLNCTGDVYNETYREDVVNHIVKWHSVFSLYYTCNMQLMNIKQEKVQELTLYRVNILNVHT